MKKKVFVFFGVLIYVTTIIGCKTFDYNTYISKEFKENNNNIINIVIKEYNKKQGTQIEKSKLYIYSIKPYEKGVLLLICYKNTVPELKLVYLIKDIDGYHISKYAEGQYDIKKFKVNKVQDGKSAIYFGSMDDSFFNNAENINTKMQQGGIEVLLDDGQSFQEKIDASQKGYILITNSKAMIVDFYSYNFKDEKKFFIKNFANYSEGINESLWKY